VNRNQSNDEPTTNPRRTTSKQYNNTTIKKREVFKPPTVFEVQKYVLDKGYQINPEKFVAYYEASGWKRGNTPIKDWKACVRTWVTNENPKAKEDREIEELFQRQ
jgi:hypothetical protein